MHEKRRYPRSAALLTCAVEKIFHNDKKVQSKVINQSQQGLRIESDYKFLPGDALKIVVYEDSFDIDATKQDYCIGMVRWCARQDGCCGGLYGIGVELAVRSKNAYWSIRG
ncbi:PilZ domain-containing protein [Desulfomicrobium escambiense]|uniref:PilZ domain-containing protein n=1 Tax=Desulfomicrobium escambiense TaxID=29503 RepID=UPI000A004279|nr:PilZ domain-containing protein [Desulfomicrobium escambiense]